MISGVILTFEAPKRRESYEMDKKSNLALGITNSTALENRISYIYN